MELKLGYKQTEVGLIPTDWEIAPIGLEFDICNNLRMPISRVVRNRMEGPYPYYGPTGIQDYINEFRVDGQYALIGEDGDHFLKWHDQPMTQLVSGRFNVNNHAHLIRGGKNLTAWFYHYFSHRDLTPYLTRQGAGRYKLTKSALAKISCAFPPTKAEQEAIAEALSDADDLISALDQLIAKKRDLKQAAMQQLLTGKQRLPGFHKKWEVKRLGDLGSTFGGLTGKTKEDFARGSARYITFMNIMTNVVIDCSTFELVDVKPTESQNKVTRGDLFFNGSSETPEEVGMCAYLAQDTQDVFLNSFCFGFRFRERASTDGLYLAYYFRSGQGRELLKSLAQGATRYNLSKTALLKVAFSLPPLPEQAAIATVLSDIDAELTALEQRRDKTRTLKQGMMQELLTGKTRLV